MSVMPKIQVPKRPPPPPPRAFYFGCWDRSGHHLFDPTGRTLPSYGEPKLHPWTTGQDGSLLGMGSIPDRPTGKVYWTIANGYWLAFVWWDRSVDDRPGSNSGFYVQGFDGAQKQEAFAFALKQFPHVADRQKYPLIIAN